MIVGSNVKLFDNIINKKLAYRKETRYYDLLPINGNYIDYTQPLKNNHFSNFRYQMPTHFDRKIKSKNGVLDKKEDKLNAKKMKIEGLQKQLARFAKDHSRLYIKLDI